METELNFSFPPQLPISSRAEEIIAAIREHQVVIVAGETGSGKTTQIPKMCWAAGFGRVGRIGCTQPRRIAALSVSKRVAEELGVTWGREVGCKIRFSDQTTKVTRLKFMTDGMLLAEVQGDPELRDYEVVILDEAHERSLNIDFLLGHLKNLLARRKDLKLLITSATIDTATFSKAFWDAPVIEVSGRMFPVEMIYMPPESLVNEEDGEGLDHIEATAKVIDLIIDEPGGGDVLVFMPSERDIRETCDLVDRKLGNHVELLPLYGRLSASEQQKVFGASDRRKVIVSTNIAETSLTIPGIRYVVDPGLARISRYNPRTRTRRLPIEPISQSSANQRAGRSGRVQNGICFRLYSEEEYKVRPPFSQPEIQRANLAEVILRLKTAALGDVETFPFINPPSPAAIKGGYQLLQELGALDEERQLTPLGRELGRLPIDPVIGRMILQAREEGVLDEVCIIATGLSIPDPRERPPEQESAADAAHKAFVSPDSDFFTLLGLWDHFHEQADKLSNQSQLRKWCHRQFISYRRMREWMDLHTQVRDSVESLRPLDRPAIDPATDMRGASKPKQSQFGPQYRAVHRSILTGLLSQVAQREERNVYKALGNRQVMLFPGSGVFERNPTKAKAFRPVADEDAPPAAKTNQPAWLMAGEIMETSRLYLRTVAAIDPEWVLDLGRHLCQFTYVHPHWEASAGRVVVREKVLLVGMELLSHWVDHGKINPEEATEMFIRGALLEDDIDTSPAFLEHNRKMRQKVEVYQTRLRSFDLAHLDERIYRFYAARLKNISSLHDLNRLVREQAGAPELFMKEEDLTKGKNFEVDASSFPDYVEINGVRLPVEYAYAPGEDHDGVSLKLTAPIAQALPPGLIEWAVPGLRVQQIEALLRALPKSLRVPLMPIEQKVREISAEMHPGIEGLPRALTRFIRQRYGIDISDSSWVLNDLPAHLRPRITVEGPGQKVLTASRDLGEVKAHVAKMQVPTGDRMWSDACKKYELDGFTSWTFGDVPRQVEIGKQGQLPIIAFPGLRCEEGHVAIRLFRQLAAAEAESRCTILWLARQEMAKDLAWLERELRALDKLKPLYVTLGPGDELTTTARDHLERQLFRSGRLSSLSQREFNSMLGQAKAEINGLGSKLVTVLQPILNLRQELLLTKKTYLGLKDDLQRLLPPRFLSVVPPERLPHLQRYLKAIKIRAERASLNPPKDQERAKVLVPFVDALKGWSARKDIAADEAVQREDFRWLLEELRVSLFAQELGTAHPVSPRRLDEFLQNAGAAPKR